MGILVIMALGVLVGFKFFPDRLHRMNNTIQVMSIIALIFCMGVSLGSNPTFMDELLTLGYKGLVFAVIPIAGSIGMVYMLTKKLMK